MRPILTHIPLLLLAPSLVVAAANFTQCMYDFQSNPHAIGGVDSRGRLTASPADAVGLTFVACEEYCGRAAETFNFGEFAKLFSSWLLPWLALISELPFGSGNYQDDFISGEPSCPFAAALITYENEISCHERWVPCTCCILPRPHFPKLSGGLSKGETHPVQGQDGRSEGIDMPSANSSRADKR